MILIRGFVIGSSSKTPACRNDTGSESLSSMYWPVQTFDQIHVPHIATVNIGWFTIYFNSQFLSSLKTLKIFIHWNIFNNLKAVINLYNSMLHNISMSTYFGLGLIGLIWFKCLKLWCSVLSYYAGYNVLLKLVNFINTTLSI